MGDSVRCRRKVLAGVTAIVGAAVMSGSSPAEAHVGGGHTTRRQAAVSNIAAPDGGSLGFQLRVRSDSRFDAAVDHAVRVWANVGGRVLITRVAAGAAADVIFRDVNRCRNEHPAWYLRTDGRGPEAAFIEMNVCELRGSSDKRRNAVAAHELGHALGLGHISPPRGQLMDRKWQGEVVAPQRLDIEHYELVWKHGPNRLSPGAAADGQAPTAAGMDEVADLDDVRDPATSAGTGDVDGEPGGHG